MINSIVTNLKNSPKKVISGLLILSIILSSNPFGIFDSKETKKLKLVLQNKETILSEVIKHASANNETITDITQLEKENEGLLSTINTINDEICGLNSQIGNEEIDPTIKCKGEDTQIVNKEKEEVKINETPIVNNNGKQQKIGYDENGNKMKWMLTRYYSPAYDQDFFKYSAKRKSNGKVAWAGKFLPENDNDRWNAYMADSLVQCGTPYQKKPSDKNLKTTIDNLAHSCGTPGITPFVDVNGKTNDYFSPEHSYKTMACDYQYIAKITDIGCSPTIKSSMVYNSKEWNDAIACRAKINKDIEFDVEGVGKAKCADAGNAINGAHLDVWVGYGNSALTELSKGNMKNLHTTSYDIGLDGKKTTSRDGFWANISIYKNGTKVY
jgi:hypothetical protein